MSEQQIVEALQIIRNDLASIKNRLTVFELRQGASDSQLLSIDSRLLAMRQSVDMIGGDLRRMADLLDRSRERV